MISCDVLHPQPKKRASAACGGEEVITVFIYLHIFMLIDSLVFSLSHEDFKKNTYFKTSQGNFLICSQYSFLHSFFLGVSVSSIIV